MGAYLSSPICEKETIEESNDQLAFVASSMQGWRMSQEDAHNAILHFDDQTSLFAVYDGHGGAEIAIYCSKYLPAFLKKLDAYREGRLKEALSEGFLKFDSLLLEPNVKRVLQKLANDESEQEEEEEESPTENDPQEGVNHEEAQLLKQEAEVPIEELLQRYNEEPTEKTDVTVTVVSEEIKITEVESSRPRRIRKPVSVDASATTTTIESNSLIRHFLTNDNEDDDDSEDSEFDVSAEETSGDEAEDHETEEDQDKAGNVQELMKKSIMALLNRRGKKNKEQTESDEDEDEEDEEEDLEMLDVDNDPGSSSGCTAVVALLRDRELFVANAGDSRCVVSRSGQAVEMSVDHKPEDLEERTRIEKAGYKVTSDGRVSGGLNLSRAIGDHAYKKKSSLSAEEQAITALPDIRTLTLDDRDEFLVIACDGIWNFMSSQDVIDFVRLRLEKKSLRQICEELFMHCLAPNTCGDGTGCDNMTAIIVRFHPSKICVPQKRALSPESKSLETHEVTQTKKFKILAENVTND